MKKVVRKTLKITGITLVVLIVLVLLIPVIFKKQITTLVKKEINSNLTAKVDFDDVSLSLFSHFPKVAISLNELTIVGTGQFEKDTLLSTQSLEATVNLISAIKGTDIKVYGVYLESPRIHALIDEDGRVNWDIAIADTISSSLSDTTASPFTMKLEHYEINNGYIYYNDEAGNMSAEIEGLNHEGSGDFTSEVFTLSTSTTVDAASFIYEAIPYLAQTRTVIDTDIEIDTKTGKYTFKTDAVSLNNLKLNAEGFFQLLNDSVYNMDFAFKTASNEFKDILSLVPGIYKSNFDEIKTDGKAELQGFVKGYYSPTQLPAFDVNLHIKDGMFKYPDLPDPVRNIQLAMQVNNPDGKPDNTVVNISSGHLEMDKEPFDFRFLLKQPMTNQYIDAMVQGNVDLGKVSRMIKLDKGTNLSGLMKADAFARGNLADLQQQAGDFRAGGYFDISRLHYSSPSVPQPINNGRMKIEINNSGGIADNTSIQLTSGHVEVGNNPIDFALNLKHPVSSIDFDGKAAGTFNLDNIRHFVSLGPGTKVSGVLEADLAFAGSNKAIENKQYDKIIVNGTASATEFKYQSPDYPTGITLHSAVLGCTGKNVTLSKLSGNYMGTNFTANGVLNNIIGYVLQEQSLTGTLNLSADRLNLNDWMGTDTTTITSSTTTAPTPFMVPSDVNMVVHAKAERVVYDKVNYDDINGTLTLKDETVRFEDVKAKALDGRIELDGSYSTVSDKKRPAISVGYNIKDMDIQKAFFAFNTVRSIMPIGKFLAGKLSSELTMTGNLDGSMMPNLGSLSGKGNLLLIEGVLSKFTPLEKLAGLLQIDRLKSISIKNIKNYIEFANGKVLVKPYSIKVDDIEMQIGGTHGFDQGIDYVIAMKVPRKYMGTQGNGLVNDLASKATARGLPVQLGEIVDLNVRMTGTMTNPSIQVDLKQVVGDAIADLKQQAVDFAKAKLDTTRQVVKDTLNAVKKQVISDLKDELKNKIIGKDTINSNNLDSTKNKAGKTLKKTFDNLLNKKKKLPSDSLR
ncbi:MAG: hypothetical protein H7Y42_08755 [Chitinophagaceae bacterium]|nr:hypothetical protein [Chitinophagaceae bacterium]